MKLLHPEIEWGSAQKYETYMKSEMSSKVTTSVDTLEVYDPTNREGNKEASVLWTENLGDNDILELFKKYLMPGRPKLTIFFLKNWEDETRCPVSNRKGVLLSHRTITAFHDHFKLSPVFINWITNPKILPSYTSHFIERNKQGQETFLHGFYFHKAMVTGDKTAIYHIYNLEDGSIFYFIANCPKDIQMKLREAGENAGIYYDPTLLFRPFGIDILIADYKAAGNDVPFMSRSSAVLKMEKIYGFTSSAREDTADPKKDLQKIFDEATLLSNAITQRNESDYQYKYLRRVAKLFLKHIHIKANTERVRIRGEVASILESLDHLECRNQIALNWLKNFQRRLDIRINLAFNLRAQEDSQTNLQIARLTTEIAVDAQRDSSSMITIAAVTMFFLPGTFICAVFSMVFFNDSVDSSGQEVFFVSRKWWYFLAATIPLTIAVFAVWMSWTARRRKEKASALKLGHENKKVDIQNDGLPSASARFGGMRILSPIWRHISSWRPGANTMTWLRTRSTPLGEETVRETV